MLLAHLWWTLRREDKQNVAKKAALTPTQHEVREMQMWLDYEESKHYWGGHIPSFTG
jgi:hypothetical protein